MDFFRKFFLLQSVGLVLTYNFSNCDFKKISDSFNYKIYHDLNDAAHGYTLNFVKLCNNALDCLTKIEHHTFNPSPGCPTLTNKTFALETNRTLSTYCSGYSRTQINTTQEMKQGKGRSSCQKQTSQILSWWCRLNRFANIL